MGKTERSTYAKEADRIRKLIKRFVNKNEYGKDIYDKLKEQIHAGDVTDFFEKASRLHSIQDIEDAYKSLAQDLGLVKSDESKKKAFKTAVAIADEELDHEYDSGVYHSPNTDAQNRIASWWNNVVKNFVAPLRHWEKLPDEVFVELKTWKEETIKLIGEENFADLIENQMSYKTEKKYGNVDYVDYFTCLYDDEQHRYETMGEVASRISFWLRIASDKALEYIPEDEDAGDYDEIIGDLLNRLENYW